MVDGQAPQQPAAGGPASAADASTADRARAGTSGPWAVYRTVYSGSGLSREEGTGIGYALDARSATTPARISQVSEALGFPEDPVLADGYWQTQNDNGPWLSVSLDGAASITFSDYSLDPASDCGAVYAELDSGPMPQDDAWNDATERYQECLDQARSDLPSEEDAFEAAKTVVGEMGIDLETVTLSSTVQEWSAMRTVTVTRSLEGSPGYVQLTLQYGPQGLAGLSGLLADPVALGHYPVISEAEALERLNDVRFGAYEVRWQDDVGLIEPDFDWVAPTEAPALPTADSPVPWAVNTVAITEVVATTVTLWSEDAAAMVMPAFELSGDDDMVYVVLAVADDALDFSTP